MICDAELVQIWEDDLWRLTMGVAVPGFSYLEPKRHIPSVIDLDGEEAATFGGVLAHVGRVLKEETGAEFVAMSIPATATSHLRIHLVPDVSIAEEQLREVAERIRRRLADDPPPRPEQPQPLLLPYPVPAPSWDPGQPEIPPPRRWPPDDPWPDRPAHDPWF